jgi:hypothetical protein
MLRALVDAACADGADTTATHSLASGFFSRER